VSARVPELPPHVVASYALDGYAGIAPFLGEIPEGEYACPGSPCGQDCPQCWGRGAVRVTGKVVRVFWPA
jgi:hypothetical protein